MGIKEDIAELVAKYNLSRYIFIACVDGEHPSSFFGEKENLLKMLDQIREAIIVYFAVKEN